MRSVSTCRSDGLRAAAVYAPGKRGRVTAAPSFSGTGC